MPYKDPDKQRLYQRLRLRQRRAEWFADKCCVRCGSRDRMELDHKDPTTKVSHNIWSWAPERFAEEVAKCQALCYYCHKNKTRLEQRSTAKHGTLAKYKGNWRSRDGCRCTPCRAANTAWKRQNQKSKRAAGELGITPVLQTGVLGS